MREVDYIAKHPNFGREILNKHGYEQEQECLYTTSERK